MPFHLQSIIACDQFLGFDPIAGHDSVCAQRLEGVTQTLHPSSGMSFEGLEDCVTGLLSDAGLGQLLQDHGWTREYALGRVFFYCPKCSGNARDGEPIVTKVDDA